MSVDKDGVGALDEALGEPGVVRHIHDAPADHGSLAGGPVDQQARDRRGVGQPGRGVVPGHAGGGQLRGDELGHGTPAERRDEVHPGAERGGGGGGVGRRPPEGQRLGQPDGLLVPARHPVDEVRDVSAGRLRALLDAIVAIDATDVATVEPERLADLVRAVFDPHIAFTEEITQFFAAINQWQSRYDLTDDEFRFFTEVLVGYVGERLDEIERLARPIGRRLETVSYTHLTLPTSDLV